MKTIKLAIYLCVISISALYSIASIATVPPYNYIKYRPVLNDSTLQTPTDLTSIAHGDFKGKKNPYFYVPRVGNKWLTFAVIGRQQGSELHQRNTWHINDGFLHKIIANVIVQNLSTDPHAQVTFMQLHDVAQNANAINKALISLIWANHKVDDGEGGTGQIFENYYWAVIKTDNCAKCENYLFVPLAQHSDTIPIKMEIKVINSKLKVKVGGVIINRIDNLDISYWNGLESYFKAGTYNHTDGTSTTSFKSLKYYKEKGVYFK